MNTLRRPKANISSFFRMLCILSISTFITIFLLFAILISTPIILLTWNKSITNVFFNLSRRFFYFWFKQVGIEMEIRGHENIPEGGCLLLSKHMSMLETCLFAVYDKLTLTQVARHSLLWLPIWNLIIFYRSIILVKRRGGFVSANNFVKILDSNLKLGKRIVIFPEGTRAEVGQYKHFHLGVLKFYPKYPILPVALNTGIAFGKKVTSLKFDCKIIVEILPPISQNLNISDAKRLIEKIILERSTELCQESIQEYEKKHNINQEAR